MELFIIAFYVLLIWMIARFCGWLFRGPRWRARQARKNWNYTDWLLSREAMRRARRGGR